MCLNTITEHHRPAIKEERWAYKLLDRCDGDYLFPFKALRLSFRVRRGVWLKREQTALWAGGGMRRLYKSGFHVFATKEGAVVHWSRGTYRVVKVRVRGIETEGWQRGHKILVCREMFVPEEEEL